MSVLEIDTDKIPSPTGYRILVKPLPPITKTEGGIDLTATLRSQEVLSQLGLVVALGPTAYDTVNFPEKYGNTVWCEEGDWILYGKYSGTKFRTKDGNEWLLLNDDSVLAKVPDPGFINRLDYGI